MRLYGCGYINECDKPGIWLFDLESGLVGESGGVVNPSYGSLADAPSDARIMYFACETEDCAKLAAYALGDDGLPEFLDECEFEGADGTCFVLVDPAGRCAYGADYNSGSICQCALNENGTFGEAWPLLQHEGHGPEREPGDPDHDRQLSPHVHTLSYIPGKEYVVAVDLGTDTIAIYAPDSDGIIDAQRCVGSVKIPAGCGPRIVAYHPTLPLAVVVCELACEVLFYSTREDGLHWELIERHGLIDGKAADWKRPDAHAGIPHEEYPPLAAHAEFSKDGRFLYVSTRGTNTITIFEVDSSGHASEAACIPCGGHSPRHFAISPDQRYLAVANQVSDEITVFERNEETGSLAELNRLACHQPSCVIWV